MMYVIFVVQEFLAVTIQSPQVCIQGKVIESQVCVRRSQDAAIYAETDQQPKYRAAKTVWKMPKGEKMALRLLKEEKRSLRDIAQATNVPSLHYVQSVNSSAKTIKMGWKGCSTPPRSREVHVYIVD